MTDSKPWYTSVTVWGGLVTLISLVAGWYGHAISPADQNTLVTNIATIATAAGGIVAIYGRVMATKTIGSS